MQQDGKDGECGRDARQIVRDLRIGCGKCGDAHPIAELAAQIGTRNAEHGKQRAQAVARAQIDDERQMHDERIYLAGEKLAADGIGDRKGSAGHDADQHQFKRMTPVDLDTAQRRRGKDAKEQRRGVVDCPKDHFDRGDHQCLPPSKRTAK